MAAKKKPVSPTSPAKKQASASSFRKKEEEGKAKAKLQARTDSTGRSGMGATAPKSTYESRMGITTNSKLNTAQNLARSIALGGVGKTILNKVVGKTVSKPKSNLTGSGKYVTPNKNVAKEYVGRGNVKTKTYYGKDVIPPNTYKTPDKKLAEQYAKKKKK